MADRKNINPARGRGKISNHPGSRGPPGMAGRGASNVDPLTVSRSGNSFMDEAGGARETRGESGGRGAARGKRTIDYDIVNTRDAMFKGTKQGTTGRQVRLSTNYFRLITKPEWSLYHYHVEFAPEVEHNAVRKGLMRVHSSVIGGHLFDGSSLYLNERLPKDVTELFSKDRNGENIRLSVKFVTQVYMTESKSLQILNIIMRKTLDGLRLQLIGRNFFDAKAKYSIPQFNLELWPGYLTSIRQHERDILLCAEITHKVMRTDTVLDILRKIIQNSRGANYKDDFKKAVIGMTVLTDYNNKFYRIDDVDFKTTPASTFPTKNGSTTFVEYYKTKHNRRITDHGQPILISNASARDIRAGRSEIIGLIPELCRATGITDEMRSNFQLMRAMGDYTRIAPEQRIQKLVEFNNRLYRTPESIAVLNQWNMSLDKRLVELTGRELNNETILYADNRKEASDRFGDWTNHFKGNYRMYNTAELNNWVVIHLDQHSNFVHSFVQTVMKVAYDMGFKIREPQYRKLRDDRSQTYTTMVDQCLNSDDLQLIMFVSSNNRPDRYAAIKKKCCVERSIPSQVILAKTIMPRGNGPNRSLMSIGSKVAVQLNCKLGYSPWNVHIPITGTMTIGFDVCHDTTDRSKSYGALVASMDLRNPRTRFFSAVSAHRNGEELSNEIGLNVVKAVRAYFDIERKLPERIFFYRDGVGEGQLRQVLEFEVENILSKLDEIYRKVKREGEVKTEPVDGDGVKRSPYKFAFIVVNKRVHARFFKDGRVNPNPGTIIDDIVTNPESSDFYLVSQSVRQGSVSPTYYTVMKHGTMELSMDKIQIYTYKMCHMYFNWSGTTRVPAVCQYAHKLAFLIGQHIHQTPHNDLNKKLYFL